jgi:hypothetical protein
MQLSAITATLIIALTAVKAVPVPQANKIGTGIYELGTGFDDSTGYDIENVGGDAENILEDSTALSAIGAPNSNNGANNAGAQQGQQVNSKKLKAKRQANKIGTGIYELGTGVDDSTGYDIENLGGDAENVLEDSTALTAIGAPNSNNGANNAGAQQGQHINSKRQIGNDAAGIDAIFQGVDAGAGQGLENGMDNAGQLIEHEGFVAGEAVPSKRNRRQLGNDAGGVDAIFQGIDAGAGQGIENGLDNAGQLVENEGFAAGQTVPNRRQRRALHA